MIKKSCFFLFLLSSLTRISSAEDCDFGPPDAPILVYDATVHKTKPKVEKSKEFLVESVTGKNGIILKITRGGCNTSTTRYAFLNLKGIPGDSAKQALVAEKLLKNFKVPEDYVTRGLSRSIEKKHFTDSRFNCGAEYGKCYIEKTENSITIVNDYPM